MPDIVRELTMLEAVVEKLAARAISEAEAHQLLGNVNTTGPNPRGGEKRRLLIGRTDGGRMLTLVIEQTLEPTSWLVITGWTATERERRMLGG